jgi:hypothetical protein
MSVEIEGFEDLTDELDRLVERLDVIDGEHQISFDELFTPDFMRTYSEFDSIDAFLDASPWTVESEADFKRIPEAKFDAYIDERTGFNSWEAMLAAATREWLSRQLPH